MTNADILAALGMTHNRVGQGIVLARYAADYSMLVEVHDAGYAWAMTLAKERRWHPTRASVQVTLYKLVTLAIEELVAPQLCRTCRGRGQLLVRKRLLIEDCPVCKGAGQRPRGDRARARFVEVDYRAWRRRWRLRYPLVASPLARATGETLGRLQTKLG
jgi:hypothetical protein